MSETQTFEFQAQTRQLLDIVIHSLYSNKEIFLRELISNASDALDRLRFEALTDPAVMDGAEVLEIRLETDPEKRVLTVSDNGIGMSRDEVIENLGTIAKSGTRELMEAAALKEGAVGKEGSGLEDLIGQFGVGFYSAFMVADKVTVVTRRAGEQTATRWESTGEGDYSLSEDRRFMRGTSVSLHLKPVDREHGLDDFTDPQVLQRLVKHYSDFVAYPIVTKMKRLDRDGSEGQGGASVEEVTLNSMKPIWTRSRESVDDEEYAQFYRHIAHDWNAPAEILNLRAEGRIEYQALLFIPETAPMDLFWRDQSWGLQLYVRRVLIMDRCEELLPPYLRFVRGVVDSSDLQLNVSREMVQQDRHIRQMRQWLTRKVLDHLAQMKEERPDEYAAFWKQFGTVLKEGMASDPEQRDRLLPLLVFASSNDDEKPTDLAGYVERMGEGQESIYYLAGGRRDLLEDSPHAEGLRAAGREILYMTDPIDEFVVGAIGEYEGHRLRSAAIAEHDTEPEPASEPAAEGDAEEGTEEAKEAPDVTLDALCDALHRSLQDEVKAVRVSSRLTTSPARLVGGENDLSPQMERFLRQTQGEAAVPHSKRTLEINRNHEIVRKLAQRLGEHSPQDIELEARLLLDYARLADGAEIADPKGLRQRLGELLVKSLS